MDWITLERVSILLVLAGTILLAFSFTADPLVEKGLRREIAKGVRGVFSPVNVKIREPLFWGGLICVFVGAILQLCLTYQV